MSSYSQNTNRKKIIFFIFAFLVFGSLLSLIIFINLRNTDSSTTQDTPVANQNVDFKDDSVDVVVNDKTFDDATDLELQDEVPVGNSNLLLFTPGNQIGYINENSKLRFVGADLPESPILFPNKFHFTNSGTIINEQFSSTIYQNNGEFLTLASSISSITPFEDEQKEVYLYIDNENQEGNYTIKQASNILLSANPPTIANLQTDEDYDVVELEIFNKTPYLLGYETFSKTGKIDIWQVTNTGVKKVKVLQNVVSAKTQNNQLLYTNELDIPNELTPYKTSVIDFSDPNLITEKELQVATRLAQENIFGNVLANRCSFRPDNTKVVCVAKQQKVIFSNPQVRDIMFEIDIESSSINFLNPNLVFSAKNIHVVF